MKHPSDINHQVYPERGREILSGYIHNKTLMCETGERITEKGQYAATFYD